MHKDNDMARAGMLMMEGLMVMVVEVNATTAKYDEYEVRD